jgi:hypothetical protein
VAYRDIGTFDLWEAPPENELADFMLRLFDYQIEYKLGVDFDEGRLGQLRDFRVSAEKSRMHLENQLVNQEITVMEFVANSDLQAMSFQKRAAAVLSPNEYEALFDLKYGEVIALADPAIVPRVGFLRKATRIQV